MKTTAKVKLSTKEQTVVTALTWQCRLASRESLRSYTGSTLNEIESALRSLKRKGLILQRRMVTLDYGVQRPLLTSNDRFSTNRVHETVWKLANRWEKASRVRSQVFWARQKAVCIFGGVYCRNRQPLQIQHDLGVAEVLAIRGVNREETWLSEDVFRLHKPGAKKVPDAVIVDQNESLSRVIEFGGRYSADQIHGFHRYWSSRQIAYELW